MLFSDQREARIPRFSDEPIPAGARRPTIAPCERKPISLKGFEEARLRSGGSLGSTRRDKADLEEHGPKQMSHMFSLPSSLVGSHSCHRARCHFAGVRDDHGLLIGTTIKTLHRRGSRTSHSSVHQSRSRPRLRPWCGWRRHRSDVLKCCTATGGGVAEWLKAAVLKTAVSQGTVGSNPTPSAMYDGVSVGLRAGLLTSRPRAGR